MSLALSQSVRFESIYFHYDINSSDVLKGLTLEIFKGERIGLIGGTGSGKSTTVDLLMGLLAPRKVGLLLMARICIILRILSYFLVGVPTLRMYLKVFSSPIIRWPKILLLVFHDTKST